VPHNGILGREFDEHEDETRFPFQRDRDRIIHTRAFRRLKGKTQVFVSGEGDHVRTRLTHTMEVAQISRDIARTLSLNEDLSECIALAHDLGHPPFGHAGEEALNEWMKKNGGRFEHNEQSHRIVALLEDHSSLYKGLNLNGEILDGILKHSTPYDFSSGRNDKHPSLEAQIVNVADEIAYTGHDCEDGMRAGLFKLEEILAVPLAAKANKRTIERGTSLRGAIIHILVNDLYESIEKEIVSRNIKTMEDISASRSPVACFSPQTREELDGLRDFLFARMYLNPKVKDKSRHGKKVVLSLCSGLIKRPSEKVIEIQKKTGGSLAEAVKDFVAGMTDEYCLMQ